MKKEIKKIYLEKSDELYGYCQVIVVDDGGDEWIVGGDYCGGIPVSSWHLLKRNVKDDEKTS